MSTAIDVAADVPSAPKQSKNPVVPQSGPLDRVMGSPCVTWNQVACVSVPAETAEAATRTATPASKNDNRLRIGFFPSAFTFLVWPLGLRAPLRHTGRGDRSHGKPGASPFEASHILHQAVETEDKNRIERLGPVCPIGHCDGRDFLERGKSFRTRGSLAPRGRSSALAPLC